MKFLNLGCGSRFIPGWTNVDSYSSSPHVITHDLREGIPFPHSSFDVVYHSHVLEHFPKNDAERFMRECCRVLKPGGIIRVAIPDLEQIARLYLEALERASRGDPEWDNHYDWILLELYDQTVREYSGGRILEYLRQDPIPNLTFVYQRIGNEARHNIRAVTGIPDEKSHHRRRYSSVVVYLRQLPRLLVGRLKVKLLGTENYRALQIGKFRLQGEVHQWMYDRYSLARLLEQTGFEHPIQKTAFDSAIDNWVEFFLDAGPDGTVYKPDSLFMEAHKSISPNQAQIVLRDQ